VASLHTQTIQQLQFQTLVGGGFHNQRNALRICFIKSVPQRSGANDGIATATLGGRSDSERDADAATAVPCGRAWPGAGGPVPVPEPALLSTHMTQSMTQLPRERHAR
jgi:hypothetical protein